MEKKRLFTVAAFMVCFCIAALSQNRTLRFFYIAHDENTISQKLIYELRNNYNDAINSPDDIAVVFYLPNGNYPVVVHVNTNHANPKDFDRIVDELQTKRSHDVDITTDLKTIPEIFNDIDNVGGKQAFSNVEWNYYINSTFWELGYNETVIAALGWILEMPEAVSKGYLSLKFYCDENDVLPVDTEQPFGPKELMNGIQFIAMPY